MVRYGENGKEEHVMGARSGWWGWKFFNGVMPMFFCDYTIGCWSRIDDQGLGFSTRFFSKLRFTDLRFF
jgi:hypothetical protein